MFFLLVSVKTFPEMDEVIQVWAIPEFVHQDCVKLIGSGGAHKHSCALKHLFIRNMCSITASSLSTCLKWKSKTCSRKWMKLRRKFFLTNVYFLMWSIKWRGKQIIKKTYFVTKLSLWEFLWVGKLSITHRDRLVYFGFMEVY